jgi:undecaprenyl-diphosphatase
MVPLEVMHWAKAALLGVVEGLTEYLPVSSTGHLILVPHLAEVAARHMPMLEIFAKSGEAEESFDVVIQFGAILAVLVHYRKLLLERFAGLFTGKKESFSLLTALVLGFLPTAIVGLLLRKKIKALLFGPMPVAIALVVGGIFIIVFERVRKARKVEGLVGLEHVTPKRALLIGLGQCVSMWPGSSRSMCTIVSGQLTGLSTTTSAEFSFLLGLPTLGAACVYEAIKARHVLASGIGLPSIVIGLVVSFFVAWAVIAVFIKYLQKNGLEPFGYYRILLGVVVFLLMRGG